MFISGCYDKFQCGDGTCIEMSMVCDVNVDCIEDGEDELNCSMYQHVVKKYSICS
jgi:hypothetical protein